jgi:NAD dependent epimerase/dehydratase family enzyme
LDDLIYLFHHALMNDEIEGPLNGTAPNPVTNREFTAVLAKVLGRPAFIPAPAALLRLAAPEIAREMLLVSQRVLPNRAIQLGFRFQYPTLEGALRHLLGRNAF